MLQFFPGKDPVAGPRNKNYVKQCYCLPFTQKIKLPKKGPNCKVIKCQGKYVYEMRNCEDTVPSIDWCIKHNLTTDSHPDHWFDDFMPIMKKAAIFTTSSERSTIESMGEYKSSAIQFRIWGSTVPIL